MSEPIKTPELANRLARAIASDIALYHGEKVVRGIQEDSLFELLAHEIREGEEHYKNRVAEEIVDHHGFFERALVDIIFKMKGEQVASPIW